MAAIRYMVKNVDAAVAFYTDLLGFELVTQMGPPFAQVKRGDLTLWLSGPGSSAARPMPDGRKPESGGWNRLVIEVDDIESVAARMKDSDEYSAEPHSADAGGGENHGVGHGGRVPRGPGQGCVPLIACITNAIRLQRHGARRARILCQWPPLGAPGTRV